MVRCAQRAPQRRGDTARDGLGGKTDRFRWRVGALGSLTEEWQVGPTAHAEGLLKVKDLWVGLGASVHDSDTWRGQLMLALDLGGKER